KPVLTAAIEVRRPRVAGLAHAENKPVPGEIVNSAHQLRRLVKLYVDCLRGSRRIEPEGAVAGWAPGRGHMDITAVESKAQLLELLCLKSLPILLARHGHPCSLQAVLIRERVRRGRFRRFTDNRPNRHSSAARDFDCAARSLLPGGAAEPDPGVG